MAVDLESPNICLPYIYLIPLVISIVRPTELVVELVRTIADCIHIRQYGCWILLVTGKIDRPTTTCIFVGELLIVIPILIIELATVLQNKSD